MANPATETACDGCALLEALVLQGIAEGCRITLMAAVNTECECSALRWTALVTQDNKICASGTGHTQDEAILVALQTLGLAA